MSDQVYRACSIKRDRRTGAEVQAIREAIISLLKADHPQTVRQVFYQLVARGVRWRAMSQMGQPRVFEDKHCWKTARAALLLRDTRPILM